MLKNFVFSVSFVLALSLILTVCSGGDDGGGTTYDPLVYESIDGNTTWRLEITKNTNRAAFTPEPGDFFTMTITVVGGVPQTSSGSVQSIAGSTFTLSHTGGGTFTVTVSTTDGMTGIIGIIPIDGSTTTITGPGTVTPKGGTFLGLTYSDKFNAGMDYEGLPVTGYLLEHSYSAALNILTSQFGKSMGEAGVQGNHEYYRMDNWVILNLIERQYYKEYRLVSRNGNSSSGAQWDIDHNTGKPIEYSDYPDAFYRKYPYTLNGDRLMCNLLGRPEPDYTVFIWQPGGRGAFPVGTWLSEFDYSNLGDPRFDTLIFRADYTFTGTRFDGRTILGNHWFADSQYLYFR